MKGAIRGEWSRQKKISCEGETAMKRSIIDKDHEAKKQKVEEYPELFQELEKIHFRMNSYFTFLSSRKHIITTFDIMKSSAELVIKRPLELLDVAKLSYLLPQDIVFEYCDENQFLMEEKKFTYRKGHEAKDVDMFELKKQEDESKFGVKQLLVFEFVDGNLKKSKTKLYHKTEMKLPIYTPESMKRLIKRRDDKFIKAVSDFLLECSAKHIEDPMLELERLATPLIPKPLEFLDPIEEMVKNGQFVKSSSERPSIPRFIEILKECSFYKDQIVENGQFSFPIKPLLYGDLEFPLSDEIWHALSASRNIENFYSHQAQLLNAINNGENVIISTSTSSGKSLIYQLPVLKALRDDQLDITTMYIFPTKALAQDQKRSLSEIFGYFPELDKISIETFDGDTEKAKRESVRRTARVIFTNPDMLHTSVLPGHLSWRGFLMRLKYVVIDELHMYKGLFGSHVLLIMRRLRRLCHWLGNDSLQFISCSATLKEPSRHMHHIFGIPEEEIVHIDEDGSPSGGKHLVVWNSPLLNSKDPGNGRESQIGECAKLLVEMMSQNIRTIAFCVVRKLCELLMKEVRTSLEKMGKPEMVPQVMSYRGGYSSHDRRKIEKEMFSGNLKLIISTNALELGIDIGTLDAVLICGFPITMLNFQQQSGRAGRRNRDSLTLVVGGDNPADQYFMRRPELLIEKDFQELLIDFDNLLVLEAHLQCALFELPLDSDLSTESVWFGDLSKIEKVCKERLILDPSDDRYHVHPRFLPWPSNNVSIRAIEEETYAVVDVTNGRNVVIEEVEASRTSFTLYDGGIFVHQGYPYLVREFNSDEKFAKVERVNVDWTTSQRDFTDVDPVEIELIRSLHGDTDVPVYFGKIETTIIVFGFFKVDAKKRILDAVEVHNPPIVIKSKGLWIDIPLELLFLIKEKGLNPAAGVHALQHAIMAMMPLFVVSGTDEIQTECKAPEKEFATRQTKRKRPARLIFYDAKGGQWGSGLATKVFEHIDDILESSLQRVEECSCDWGCPECVVATFCKEQSLVVSKPLAIIILRMILGKPIDPDLILDGPEPNMPELKVETIVAVGGHVKFSKDVEIIDVKKAKRRLTQIPKQEEDIVEISRHDLNEIEDIKVEEIHVKKEEE